MLYNGTGGATYGTTTTFSETITDLGSGYGVVVVNYPSNGLQNGSPDGMALVDDSNTVIQFLSYEGAFAATGGPANGLTSTDIGVSEDGTGAAGDSLQLTGTGTIYEDFTWAADAASTFGAANTGQTFGTTELPTDPSGTGAASPDSLLAGESTLLTVTVTPGTNPVSTNLGAFCDLSAIGGAESQTFFDDGITAGDEHADDNVFSYYATVPGDTAIGAKSLPCSVSDNNVEHSNGQTSISLTVTAPLPDPGDVVISQVYGGGGNSGATYKNDFIELYNRTADPIDLTGWSVQYGSATGSSWSNKTDLSGSIEAGKYYLVQEGAGGGGSVNLPTPDATGSIAMSGTNGKVALVFNTTLLTGTGCPIGTNISDFVGYGSTANCYEGTGAAPVLTNTTADFRKLDGAQDTDINSADFETGAPLPRNSNYPFGGVGLATPAAVVSGATTLLTVAVTPGINPDSTGIAVSCDLTEIGGSATQTLYDDGTHGDDPGGDNTFSFSTTATGTGNKSLPCTLTDLSGRSETTAISLNFIAILPIGTVNGAVANGDDGTAHASPYVGQTVYIQGVIYEKTLQATSTTGTYKGFFIQNTAATADADPNTSDGLFVYMGTYSDLIGGYTPIVGDEVVISGTISEYYNMTELTSATLVEFVGSGVDIAPVVAEPPAALADANRYWERLQGMRVQVPQNSRVLGGRNVFSPADAEVWVVSPDYTAITGRGNAYEQRAFRDASTLDDNYDAVNWDGNGYRILMGSLGIKAAADDAQVLINPAHTFQTVTNAPAGGLNYTYSKYRIEITGQPTFSDGVDPALNDPPAALPDPNLAYRIADYNLENLYDYRNDPFSGCDFATDTGCDNSGTPFLSPITPSFDYVPADNAVYQARLNDIALQIINNLDSPDILMLQEVENQDICVVDAGAMVCGSTDNADGQPDVLQDLALKIVANGGPLYYAAFDRDSSDLRGIAPAFMYRADRVELVDPVGDPLLGTTPAIVYAGAGVPANAEVSNPKTLNAELPGGVSACETSWVFPRAPDVGLFRIFTTSLAGGFYTDVYVVNNHFKSGPDSCVAHRTEQAKYNAAIVSFLQGVNPHAQIVLGGDLNVYPHPDNTSYGAADQLAALYDASIGLTNLWEVINAAHPKSAYSYVYLGMAQTLDQMFVNQEMDDKLQDYHIVHVNSDFPADYPGDSARGTSDHDPQVADFTFGPLLDITGATADGSAMSGDLASGYILDTTNDPAIDHLIQFAAGTSANETLKSEYFGLKLVDSTVSAADLKAYYLARGVPSDFLAYLDDAADGIKPFVYINGATVTLVDAAKHDLIFTDVDMTVPDDFPLGTYTVQGQIQDLAGNPTTVTLKLVVTLNVIL